MDFSHIRAGYLRRFIYECKWRINFFKDPVYSLYIYNVYISTAQQKKVANESSIDYFKYTGFSIYPAYVAMEKSPLKVALIQEAEGRKIIILLKKRDIRQIYFLYLVEIRVLKNKRNPTSFAPPITLHYPI